MEEITFLFSFPVTVSAGEAVTTFTRPDAKADPFSHKGAGDRFEFSFNRTVVPAGFVGDWTIAMNAQGTAGAFAALFGFSDDVVTL
jgi:hypothetical protein